MNIKEAPTSSAGLNGGFTKYVPIDPQLPKGAQTTLPFEPHMAATQKRSACQSVTAAALSQAAQQSPTRCRRTGRDRIAQTNRVYSVGVTEQLKLALANKEAEQLLIRDERDRDHI